MFILCYPLANHLAQQAQVRRSFALGLDAAVPFVPWMIVPYASSGLVFTLVFFRVRTAEQLRVVSRRLMLATVAGTLVFAFIPARFSRARPIVEDALPAALFRWLDMVDLPYNQLPSLHVAYSVILWFALAPLMKGGVRALLGALLLMVGASATLTWQHHLADLAAGLVLGAVCAFVVQPGHTRRHTVAFHYALASGVLLLVGVFVLRSWILGYAAASLFLVAYAYLVRRAGFLFKRDGRHALVAWLLYWPYLTGYRLTWFLVLLRERRHPALTQHGPNLWFGRRLTEAEARVLPVRCHVIDLCAELPEATSLRGQRYSSFPLFDLQAPRPSELRQVLDALDRLQRAGEPVYVHCAMGYSRSRLINRLHTRKHPPCRYRSTS